jgi:NAD(P)-dependent dehydrogenase (short-subunit alcohol dehydrogenase family)
MTKATLITGANKGLGRETARRLLAEGHEVWLATRDTSLGQAAADELGARFVQLDVTDEDSVTAAAALVAAANGGRLDVLINNAGIAGDRKSAGEVTADDVRSVFETNVVGGRARHARVPAAARALGQSRDRQRLERDGLDRGDDRPRAVRVNADRDRVPGLEDGREHAHDAVREGVPADPDQHRRSGLHRDRPERA